jgi:hypothetical protein
VQAAAIKEGVEKQVKAMVHKMSFQPTVPQPMFWPYALPPPPIQPAVQQQVDESDSE